MRKIELIQAAAVVVAVAVAVAEEMVAVRVEINKNPKVRRPVQAKSTRVSSPRVGVWEKCEARIKRAGAILKSGGGGGGGGGGGASSEKLPRVNARARSGG